MKKLTTDNGVPFTLDPEFTTPGVAIITDTPDEKCAGLVHRIHGTGSDGKTVIDLQLQHGPRGVKGSTEGIQLHEILEIMIFNYKALVTNGFKEGNEVTLKHLEQAIKCDEKRTLARRKAGIENSYQQDDGTNTTTPSIGYRDKDGIPLDKDGNPVPCKVQVKAEAETTAA